MPANRRTFLLSAAVIGQAVAIGPSLAATPVVEASDPQAKALGYTVDAEKVAPAFEARHAAGAHCGNCALFQGRAADAAGACPLFGGKAVQVKGWCGSWVAKG